MFFCYTRNFSPFYRKFLLYRKYSANNVFLQLFCTLPGNTYWRSSDEGNIPFLKLLKDTNESFEKMIFIAII